MYRFPEIVDDEGLAFGNDSHDPEVTEKLVGVCSEHDAVFEQTNIPNAAQWMSVDFCHHNLAMHAGTAHLEGPYPVHE